MKNLLPVLIESSKGNPLPGELKIKSQSSMIVVLASKGYPEAYPKGEVITEPDKLPENSQLIHAGTAFTKMGEVLPMEAGCWVQLVVVILFLMRKIVPTPFANWLNTNQSTTEKI